GDRARRPGGGPRRGRRAGRQGAARRRAGRRPARPRRGGRALMGRHSIGAKTEPMQAINPPRDPAPETTSMPAITPADVAAYDQQRKAMTPEEWMQPLR